MLETATSELRQENAKLRQENAELRQRFAASAIFSVSVGLCCCLGRKQSASKELYERVGIPEHMGRENTDEDKEVWIV